MGKELKHRDPFIKTISYEANDGSYEKIMVLVFRSWEKPNSLETIPMSCDSLGYLLLDLLNMDIELVCSRLSESKSNHHQLCSENEALRLYLPEEAEDLLRTLSGSSTFSIQRIKEYLAFCDDKKLHYHTRFFDFLNQNSFFGCFFDIPEAGSTMSGVYDIDDDLSLRSSTPGIEGLYTSFLSLGLAIDSVQYSFDSQHRLPAIMLASLCEIDKAGTKIKKCKNCGKYFFPTNRSDELYCDGLSPQESTMTCKQYGTNRLWYQRQKKDEVAALSRKVASSKGMLAKRNPDIPQYARSYEYFKEQRRIWTKSVEEGTKTQDEYREWLIYMQSQKRIKEACNGID